MLVLNFSHPFTAEQQTQIETLVGRALEDVRTIPLQINEAELLEPQIVATVDAAGISPEEWQTRLTSTHKSSRIESKRVQRRFHC